MALFSVIIPTCHRNVDLATCLEALQPEGHDPVASSETTSALRKGDFYYEVIVTDDGARSTAEALVREKFPCVRWFQGPRRGPAANRNFGATKASGEWLLFLDDDCVPLTGWLEAYAVATVSFTENSVFEGRTVAPGPRVRADHESPLNLAGGLLWSCNFGIKRHLFLDLGGFDEQFPAPAFEDMDLQTRLKQIGYDSKFLADATVQHPWRPRRGTRFCVALAKSTRYFISKHPEARATFAKAWGIKRMFIIICIEFPHNLLRYRDLGSFRVLYLDLLTAIHILLNLSPQRTPKTR